MRTVLLLALRYSLRLGKEVGLVLGHRVGGQDSKPSEASVLRDALQFFLPVLLSSLPFYPQTQREAQVGPSWPGVVGQGYGVLSILA